MTGFFTLISSFFAALMGFWNGLSGTAKIILVGTIVLLISVSLAFTRGCKTGRAIEDRKNDRQERFERGGNGWFPRWRNRRSEADESKDPEAIETQEIK